MKITDTSNVFFYKYFNWCYEIHFYSVNGIQYYSLCYSLSIVRIWITVQSLVVIPYSESQRQKKNFAWYDWCKVFGNRTIKFQSGICEFLTRMELRLSRTKMAHFTLCCDSEPLNINLNWVQTLFFAWIWQNSLNLNKFSHEIGKIVWI